MTQQQPRGRGQHGGQQYYDEYQHLIPQSGIEFDEDLTSELRVAIHDLEDVSRKTKWCIDKMVDEGPEMGSCVRACRDVGFVADLVVDFVASDSIYTTDGALLFVTVAEDAVQEIRSHEHPHCQETADAVGRAIDSAWGILEGFGDPTTFEQALDQFQQVRQEVRQTQKFPHAMGGQGGQTGQGGQGSGSYRGSQSGTQGGQQFGTQGGQQSGTYRGGQQSGAQRGGQQSGMQGGQQFGTQGGQQSGTYQGGRQQSGTQGRQQFDTQGNYQSGRQGQFGGRSGRRR